MPRTPGSIAVLIGALTVTLFATLSVSNPAAATEIAPPSGPTASMWAEITPACIGDDQSHPGFRYKLGNNTNAKKIYSIVVDGQVAYELMLSPGETRSGSLWGDQWEDTYKSIQVVWKGQDVVLAERTPWLDCLQPDLSHSFGKVDPHGAPCAGLVQVELSNTGTQAAEVRLQAGQGLGQMTELSLEPGGAVIKQVHVGSGTWVVASYYRPYFDGWEFFVEAEAVDCADSLPHLPPPAEDAPHEGDQDGGGSDDGNGGAPKFDEPADLPGGTWQDGDDPRPGVKDDLPDPVVADPAAAVEDQVGMRIDRGVGHRARERSAQDAPGSGGGAPLWALASLLVLAGAGAAAAAHRDLRARR